ncbi:DUF2956 domain-containing protein [Vibrio tapetis subsp. quintayensis]|uniref:DUF2956 domain-containing protein n=1 Tax=Vibrio tapetis TaxID=52443 RepID=UPI0025B32853|nr:DUF2956 domain-containing protein [Vibrio tapetis]MDN3682664.1 DUF2956 domain-containing protein [Vibrio tapetis subsp. quintayensis]
MNQKKVIPSEQTQVEAMKIAKATQKQGQTKEQTKLVAQGIEKGIALYKKQQKEKQRQADRAKKKERKYKQTESLEVTSDTASTPESNPSQPTQWLPWCLLIVSWIGFVAYTTLGIQ